MKMTKSTLEADSQSNRLKYIIITPVRDEVQYIGETIASVTGQTILPFQWIIVDDGSTDGTSEILDKYEAQASWIKVVHRKDRGCRVAGGGVIEAFYDGFSVLSEQSWEFIVKLDGDLSFAPDYFEQCFKIFGDENNLGIGGGTICQMETGQLKVDSMGDPLFHVRGATKIYRRACWEKISPLIQAPGWDTIDEVKANLHGWTTRTFSDLKLLQHKPTGGADGNWRNWFKNGRANYITGYHPVFMLLKCVKRALHKPILLESVALLAGFCSGYILKIPQVPDNQAIRYIRQQQIRRLLLQPSIYN
jgi:glycosyltransferase involved in cell wall biosynthesis